MEEKIVETSTEKTIEESTTKSKKKYRPSPYPAYDKFPFEPSPEYKIDPPEECDLQYHELFEAMTNEPEVPESVKEWHQQIKNCLVNKTISQIINDYGKKRYSKRKRSENIQEKISYTDFYKTVICPRFALNLCHEIKKQSKKLQQKTEFFYYSVVNSILEDYETYLMLLKNTTNSNDDKLNNLMERLVYQTLPVFGIPVAQSFENGFKSEEYKYQSGTLIYTAEAEKDNTTTSCLKVLNEIFYQYPKYPLVKNSGKNGIILFFNIAIDADTIVSLLKIAFPDDIYYIRQGKDFVQFQYNAKKLCNSANQKDNGPFVYLLITFISKQHHTLDEIVDRYTTLKSYIV